MGEPSSSLKVNLKGEKTMKRILEQLELSPSLFRDLKMKRRKLSDYIFNDSESVVSADSGISGVSSCSSESTNSPNSSSAGDGNDCDLYNGDSAASNAESSSVSGDNADLKDNSSSQDVEEAEEADRSRRDDGSTVVRSNSLPSSTPEPQPGINAPPIIITSGSPDPMVNETSESSENMREMIERKISSPPSSSFPDARRFYNGRSRENSIYLTENDKMFSLREIKSEDGGSFILPDENGKRNVHTKINTFHGDGIPKGTLPPVTEATSNMMNGITCTSFPPNLQWMQQPSIIDKKGKGHVPPDFNQMMVPVVTAVPAMALSASNGQMMTFPILNVNFSEGNNGSKELVLLNSSGMPCGKVAEITKQESHISNLSVASVGNGLDKPPSMQFQFKTEPGPPRRNDVPTKFIHQNGRSNKTVTLDWNYLSELQRLQADQIRGSKDSTSKEEDAEDGEALTCDICNDRATGLHYGIITCEGCKGFFKRTVQNKRVYTCVGNGNCVINKAQRNRCQFCRFKKCMEKGMILAAVREDRMPGGRNSGAIYNAYRVKYKRQKKREENVSAEKPDRESRSVDTKAFYESMENTTGSYMNNWSSSNGGDQYVVPSAMSPVTTGDCSLWKGARGIPSKSIGDDSAPNRPSTSTSQITGIPDPQSPPPLSPGDDRARRMWQGPSCTPDECSNNVDYLIKCEKKDSVMLYRLPLTMNQDISQVLCKLADEIVCELVLWMKQMPIYKLFSAETRTNMLSNKWHELLVLATSVHHAEISLCKNGTINLLPPENCQSEPLTPALSKQIEHNVKVNMDLLHQYLTVVMKQEVTIQQLYQDLGDLVEKITICMHIFEVLRITKEEFVCLKVILLLSHVESKVDGRALHDARTKQMSVLKCYVRMNFPDQPNRFGELMRQLPRIRESADILLKNRLIYIPFLFNSVFNWH